MDDDNQIHVPPSFMAVYTDARGRLTDKADAVRTRYELCEDLSVLLVDDSTYFGDLFDRNPRAPRRVYVVATGGQAAIMADRFDDADIEMVVLPRSEYAAACAQYFDGITETVPTIVHRKGGQLDLDIAVAGAAWTSTQPRVWDPGKSSTVISPLVAVSIAPWAFNLEQERAAAYDVESSVA